MRLAGRYNTFRVSSIDLPVGPQDRRARRADLRGRDAGVPQQRAVRFARRRAALFTV